MKRLFACLLLIPLSHFASADTLHNVSLVLGSNTGGTTFGLEYEYKVDPTYNLGAFIRSFQKKSTGTYRTEGELIIGADMPIHFYQQGKFDFALAPGFALVDVNSYQNTPGDATTVGPNLALSMMYQINEKFSAGIEAARYWIWFNSDYTGLVRDDLAAKFQLAF